MPIGCLRRGCATCEGAPRTRCADVTNAWTLLNFRITKVEKMDVMEDAGSAILDYQMHAVMAFVKVKIGGNLWKPRFMTHVKSCPNSSKRAHSPNQATKSGKKVNQVIKREALLSPI